VLWILTFCSSFSQIFLLVFACSCFWSGYKTLSFFYLFLLFSSWQLLCFLGAFKIVRLLSHWIEKKKKQLLCMNLSPVLLLQCLLNCYFSGISTRWLELTSFNQRKTNVINFLEEQAVKHSWWRVLGAGKCIIFLQSGIQLRLSWCSCQHPPNRFWIILLFCHDLRRRMIRDLDSQPPQILVIGILDQEYYI